MDWAYRAVNEKPPPRRGEVWWVILDPVVGHELGGHKRDEPYTSRPAVVVSDDEINTAVVVSDDRLNTGASGLAIIVPITGTLKSNPFHVFLDEGDGGLTKQSAALCDHVRSISTIRLRGRQGVLSATALARIEVRLRSVLRLPTYPTS